MNSNSRHTAIGALAATILAGCGSHQPPVSIDFGSSTSADGRVVVWWLKIPGRDVDRFAHAAAGEHFVGDATAAVDHEARTLIIEGMTRKGLVLCDPQWTTVAQLSDGGLQFNGFCTRPTPTSWGT